MESFSNFPEETLITQNNLEGMAALAMACSMGTAIFRIWEAPKFRQLSFNYSVFLRNLEFIRWIEIFSNFPEETVITQTHLKSIAALAMACSIENRNFQDLRSSLISAIRTRLFSFIKKSWIYSLDWNFQQFSWRNRDHSEHLESMAALAMACSMGTAIFRFWEAP